jgi:voltage-gated potassium channel
MRGFLESPASVRNAVRVIVVATVTTTLVGAALVWIFDSKDFDNFGTAMWWSLQTVTTVGYGDVTPKNGVGRIIGSVVLLYAVAFMSILTAAITTSFVERARRQRLDEGPSMQLLLDRLDEISLRLDRLEQQRGITRGE